ncbi:MAG: polysaccharide pyruvyl transferase family protein [Paracoccaceae bacterium]
MRILYVTTRQWNPGDEFILRGSRRIMAACGVTETVSAIYNKSPQTTSLLESLNFWKRPYYTSLWSSVDFALNVTHYDNSFKRNHDLNFYDAVVFAGSPAWYGGRLKPLYAKLKDYRGKILFLGIGTPNKPLNLSADEQAVLRRATVFCRNRGLADNLGKLGIAARYLPCPALLSSPVERAAPVSLGLIGLGFNTTRSHRYHRMSEEKFQAQSRIFDFLMSRYDCRIIAHYIDELPEATRLYGADRIRYVFDAVDYPGVYSEYDFVVSSRVHGCGMASSCAVPNAAITHDARGDTVTGFLSDRVGDLAGMERLIDDLQFGLANRSAALRAHKAATLDAYVAALTPVLAG